MDFVDWLLTQTKRPDEIGWLSRLVASNTSSEQELRKEASPTHIDNLPDSKIRRTIVEAYRECTKTSKLAGEPKVGIFWIIKGEIVEFMTDASKVAPIAGFKDSPYDHLTMWDEVQKMWPTTRGKDYISIPRGRVIGVGPERFRIFLPPKEVRNNSLINNIMAVFNLPKKSY